MTLDPARWSYRPLRVAWAVWLGLGIVTVAGVRVGIPSWASSLWFVATPAFYGVFGWRVMGAAWRDLASWVVPFTVVIALASASRSTLGDAIVAVGYLLSFAMLFDVISDRWYRFVLRRPQRWPADNDHEPPAATT